MAVSIIAKDLIFNIKSQISFGQNLEIFNFRYVILKKGES